MKQLVVKGGGTVPGLMSVDKLLSQLRLAGFVDIAADTADLNESERKLAEEGASKLQLSLTDKLESLQYVQVFDGLNSAGQIRMHHNHNMKILSNISSLVFNNSSDIKSKF